MCRRVKSRKNRRCRRTPTTSRSPIRPSNAPRPGPPSPTTTVVHRCRPPPPLRTPPRRRSRRRWPVCRWTTATRRSLRLSNPLGIHAAASQQVLVNSRLRRHQMIARTMRHAQLARPLPRSNSYAGCTNNSSSSTATCSKTILSPSVGASASLTRRRRVRAIGCASSSRRRWPPGTPTSAPPPGRNGRRRRTVRRRRRMRRRRIRRGRLQFRQGTRPGQPLPERALPRARPGHHARTKRHRCRNLIKMSLRRNPSKYPLPLVPIVAENLNNSRPLR